ncbi:MAG: beta-ketoacyl-ACP synthase III [Bdellovibrionia bacterium]
MAGIYRSRIAGTGSFLPEKVLTNADLEKMVDTNDQWIVERTGIERRHIAAEGEACSDLAFRASQMALKDANLTAQDLDMIIVATVSGDQVMPSTACVLQSRLGAKNVMAFDLSAACSGFVYGLSVADQFIRTGVYKNILVIGAEVLHPYVNYKDRDTCILFGDGAGAWIISRADESDKNIIHSSHCHAEGSLGDLFVLPAGGSKLPFSQSVLDNNQQYMTMKGREIFKNAVRTMSHACQEALDANKMQAQDIDWIIPHQANKRIIEAVADHFKVPIEKVIIRLQETGNTSAASIPLAFEMAKQEGKIQRGQNILLTAFGAGLTSGSLLMRY